MIKETNKLHKNIKQTKKKKQHDLLKTGTTQKSSVDFFFLGLRSFSYTIITNKKLNPEKKNCHQYFDYAQINIIAKSSQIYQNSLNQLKLIITYFNLCQW
eukprot:TRINITY_DN13372_c0_g1_i2.p3 TRINITY_DN13372_c0_g1~~TRINITY_DN13372_c0_g1_i2.p3  ORF type:complete len:100 (-),score=3.39 TRINITY_DN13372_c0_g1_i2:117-416(-)